MSPNGEARRSGLTQWMPHTCEHLKTAELAQNRVPTWAWLNHEKILKHYLKSLHFTVVCYTEKADWYNILQKKKVYFLLLSGCSCGPQALHPTLPQGEGWMNEGKAIGPPWPSTINIGQYRVAIVGEHCHVPGTGPHLNLLICTYLLFHFILYYHVMVFISFYRNVH